MESTKLTTKLARKFTKSVARVVFMLLLLTWTGALVHAETLGEWTLTEHLGHEWKNALVQFPTAPAHRPGAEPGFALTDGTGAPLPFQFTLLPDRGEAPTAKVAVLVDLAAYASLTLRLSTADTSRTNPTDVRVERNAACFILSAGRMAVKVARAQNFRPGAAFRSLPAPIQAVRGASGRWMGKGALLGDAPVRAFTTKLEAEGPIFAQVCVRYEFDDRKFHQVRIRVISGEDVVLVEEDFALSLDELASTPFVEPPDLAPEIGTPSTLTDWLLNRGMGWKNVVTDTNAYPCFAFDFFHGWGANRATLYNLSGGKPFKADDLRAAREDWATGLVLTPYQARGNRACAVVADDEANGADKLGIFYRRLGRWEHPNENRVPLPWLERGLVGHFFAFEGRREWGLAIGGPEDAVEDKAGEHGTAVYGFIRQPMVKHGETPLDKVKDWALAWDLPEGTAYPRLFCTDDSLARVRLDFASPPEPAREIVGQDAHVIALMTGNDDGLRKAFGGLDGLREPVTAFLAGGHNTTDSYTHRFQEIVRHSGQTLDVGLACASLTEDERRRALATVAFLAYKVSDPDYWPYRGYGGGPSNPNMMGIACNALATLAGMCPGHPKQEQWLRLCERLVCADILMSIGPEGAWLESPGYQGAGNTPINQTVLILRNAGIADLARDPVFGKRLLSVSTYFANLLTPPDPRFDGKRMPMALGDNVPYFNNMYTYLAHAGKDAFPAAAGHAMWCWEQMGRPSRRATLIMLNEHVLDGGVPTVSISGRSRAFPGFGAMLRHGFGTEHETFLTYRQNSFSYGHYDDDMGSFSLFAKGAPLCLDWMDYSPGKAEHHNRVDHHPDILPWLVTPPDAFVTRGEADYIRSHETGLPAGAPHRTMPTDAGADWQRQLILVKDTSDPGDATYLVLRDVVLADRPSEWNCWVMAEEGSQQIDGPVARLRGQFGVDVAFFFYRKPPRALETTFLHHQTRSYMKMDQDQVRVQAAAERGGDYGVVIYPLRRGVDQEPTVREFETGVVELAWPSGRRHLVFLFPENREVTGNGFRFDGRAAVAKYEQGAWRQVALEGTLLTTAQ